MCHNSSSKDLAETSATPAVNNASQWIGEKVREVMTTISDRSLSLSSTSHPGYCPTHYTWNQRDWNWLCISFESHALQLGV